MVFRMCGRSSRTSFSLIPTSLDIALDENSPCRNSSIIFCRIVRICRSSDRGNHEYLTSSAIIVEDSMSGVVTANYFNKTGIYD